MHIVQSSDTPMAPEIEFGDFMKVDIRVGTVIKAEEFPQARKPAYKLWVDFGGSIGVKKSSAQITDRYSLTELIDLKVAAVVNFPPRQIGPFMSEILVLGFPNENGEIILFAPDSHVPNGSRLA